MPTLLTLKAIPPVQVVNTMGSVTAHHAKCLGTERLAGRGERVGAERVCVIADHRPAELARLGDSDRDGDC